MPEHMTGNAIQRTVPLSTLNIFIGHVHLIFITVIPVLVIQYLYIVMSPDFICVSTLGLSYLKDIVIWV